MKVSRPAVELWRGERILSLFLCFRSHRHLCIRLHPDLHPKFAIEEEAEPFEQ
jgi:hypothetical protein